MEKKVDGVLLIKTTTERKNKDIKTTKKNKEPSKINKLKIHSENIKMKAIKYMKILINNITNYK